MIKLLTSIPDLTLDVEQAPAAAIRRTGRIVLGFGRGRRIRKKEMTPSQARLLARLLERAADEAEALRGAGA